jgi:glycosyltransferase involved in cell wall biosynthesis
VETPGISVVCNTFNSEMYLDLVLKSVKDLADEVIVCDMHSTDKTQQIVHDHNATLLLHEPIGYVEPARHFAVSQAKNDWILIIDSDEILDPKMIPHLKQIAANNEENAIWIPEENHMFGNSVHGAGFAPDQDSHLRFFRKEVVDLKPELHAGIIAKPNAKRLILNSQEHGSIIHFGHISIYDFVNKLNKYTSIEVDNKESLGPKSQRRILRRCFSEYRHRYFRRGGKNCGWRGFAVSLLMVCYDIITELKVIERAHGHTREKTIEDYRKVAEKILNN